MPLTKEEIEQIAKEVAKRVLRKGQACRCARGLWEVRSNHLSLYAVIEAESPGWLQPTPRIMEGNLAIVEEACGVNMAKPKELTRLVEDNIQREDWREAKVNVALLKGAILGPIEECAEEA